MAELEVCYSSLAEMHAYELITPISKGKNVFISLWLKPHQRVELFFFSSPSSVLFLLFVTRSLTLL